MATGQGEGKGEGEVHEPRTLLLLLLVTVVPCDLGNLGKTTNGELNRCESVLVSWGKCLSGLGLRGTLDTCIGRCPSFSSSPGAPMANG